MQKVKRSKQVKIQKLLMKEMPKQEKLAAFFTIQPPESSHFPLEQTYLEGVQLVEQYIPQQIKKLMTSSFMPQRITKFKGKLCIQGRGGIIIGQQFLKITEVSAMAFSTNHFVVAFENTSLNIYGSNLQLIKEVKNFTERKITVLKIVETPPEFQGLILMSSNGNELFVHRFEKTFFNPMSSKLNAKITDSKQPIVFIAELPRRYKHYLKEDQQYRYAGLYCVLSGTQLWIVKVDNSILTSQRFAQIVYAKQHRNPMRLSYASWGQRQVNGTTQLVLTYSFGHNLYMAILNNISKFLESQTRVRYEWIQSEALSMVVAMEDEKDKDKEPIPRPIIFCSHIKKNQILLILQDTNQINIFHTAGLDLFDKSAQSTQLQIITYSFGNKITPRFVRSDNSGDIVSYTDCFAFQLTNNDIAFLSGDVVGIYVYLNWKQISDLLKGAQNYFSAMNFLIALYRKFNRFDLGVSTSQKFDEELSEYVCNLTLDYLKVTLPRLSTLTEQEVLDKLNKQYSETLDLLLAPIQLLVNTSEFVFLFQNVKFKIINAFSQKVFYKMLQPFIRHARIKYIPQNQLKQTLDYYVSNDQLDLVQRLAIYFDLEQIEKGIVIQCCINNNLAVSLAFICTQGNEGQFVTPFVKFWGLGQSYRKQGDLEYAQLFAIRALWYVRLCLQRNMALKQFSYEKYGYLISILTENFFTKNMITGLLDMRVEACLETLSYYFTMENASIVNNFCKLRINVHEIKILDYIRPKPDNQRLQIVLSAIYLFLDEVTQKRQSEQERQLDEQLFMLLLSKIIIYKSVKFTKPKYISILKYLINQHQTIQRINYGLEGDQLQILSEQTHQVLASEYINKLLALIVNEQIQAEDPIKREEMADIYYCSRQQVDLTELQAQINFINGHYGACIDVFVRAQEGARQRVFKFIENSFKNLEIQKKKKERKLLQKEVKDKIPQLIPLNPQKAIHLIQSYLPDSQQELIKALEEDPGTQLEYLQSLIASFSKVSDKSILKFVERMCELKPTELLQILKKHTNFPVEQCLKICEDYEIFDCMQYLYQRMGNIEKSVEIATKRIDQILSQRISFEELEMQPYIKISIILSNAIDVCIKNHSESVWQSLFDSAVSLFKKYRNNRQYAGDIGLFYEMNAKIMYEMMRYCSVDHSIWLIKQKYKSLDMGGNMRNAFIETLSNFSYSQNILFSANNLTRNILAEFQTDYVIKNMKSYAVMAYCQSCRESLDKTQKCLSFYCGHNYHKECVPVNATYCISCLSQEQNQFNMYLNTANQQNSKFKLDKLIEQSEELRRANHDKFKQEQSKYEQKMMETKKSSEEQGRMSKLLGFDDMVKTQEDSSELIQAQLNRKHRGSRQVKAK